MQCAIYARVSTEDQNCDMQLRDLRQYAGRMEWEPVEFIEHASSIKLRPVFERMMAAARRREFPVILVWRIDRWARSMKDFVFTVGELDAAKVRLISTTESVDTGDQNPFAEFQRGLLALLAQLERKIIVARVRAGMASAKARGIHCGRPPVVVDRSKVMIMHNAGYSLRAIARKHKISYKTVGRIVASWKPISKPAA
ncbi:MAG TPA: recombinase family protein [Bryobacteraceae bacterium]|jgi:DNA invertase Pin-like site-specific DNA recombinase|nr:recombinase family protein [Bryobacteraceae bacterium]